MDASPGEITLVRKENEALKEQLAQVQNELAAAQKRITELEQEIPPQTNAGGEI